MRRASILLSGLLLPSLLGGCGFDVTGDCAPHHQETIPAPDGRHVAERWVSICGAPGATVTDLVSISERPVPQPLWSGVFVFNEEVASPEQVSAAWVGDHHLSITIDAIGEVHDSPRRIGDVDVTYVLGPSAAIEVAEAKRDGRIEERRQWERLKTSASWSYVETGYNLDADLIDRYQKFIDWARVNVAPRP